MIPGYFTAALGFLSLLPFTEVFQRSQKIPEGYRVQPVFFLFQVQVDVGKVYTVQL